MSLSEIQTFVSHAWSGFPGSRLYFGLTLAIAAFLIWLFFSWRYSGIVSSLRKRLYIAEQHWMEFRRIFPDRTPAAVAERIHQLEAYVAALPARGLTEQQKSAIAAIGSPPLAASYLTVTHDVTCAEARRYAGQLVEAFTAASGWNVVNRPCPMDPHTHMGGLAVGVADPANPTPTEVLAMVALRDAGIAYELAHESAREGDVEIIVCAR